MSFAHPLLLLVLPGLLLAAGATLLWRRTLLRGLASLGVGHVDHAASLARRRGAVRFVLLWSGLALTLLALAGPRWGGADAVRQARGADVMICLDCSRSMLADDLKPTRMAVARRKALDLLAIAPELRIGVVPFAGIATLRCPPTGDRDALSRMLDDCDPAMFPADQGLQGTAIGAGVQVALTTLNRGRERGQAILVLSDGSDTDGAGVQAAGAAAKAAGIPVFGLFLGDAERKVDLLVDGTMQTMTPDRSTLTALADATDALCVDRTLDRSDVIRLRDEIAARVAIGGWEERARTLASERYQLVLVPALLLLACGLLLPTRRRDP